MNKDLSFSFELIGSLSFKITNLKIANKYAIATTRNSLLRFQIDSIEIIEEIRFPSEQDEVYKMFIDPCGHHVLVCTKAGQCYYLHRTMSKFRVLKEAKDCYIECIGWNRLYSNDQSTSNILLGTKKGELIETKLSVGNSADQYWKVIHNLENAITGIVFDSYPDSNHTKYFLIITTSTNLYPRLFSFGSPVKAFSVFAQEFERINAQVEGPKSTTFPYDIDFSQLDVFYSKKCQFPKYLSWLTGAGVYYAPFNNSSSGADASLFEKPKLLNFSSTSVKAKPLSLANTEFHVVLQYSDSLDILCTLSEASVISKKTETLTAGEPFLGLAKDDATGLILLHTRSRIFRVNYDNETKFLWKVLLEKQNFELALQYCNNNEERNYVKTKKADFLFNKEQYIEAANTYATTSLAFEEVTLKFIDLEDKIALRAYLLAFSEGFQQQLGTGGTQSTNRLQNTYDVMCIWMLELIFESVNRQLSAKTHQSITGSAIAITHGQLKANNPEYLRFVQQANVIKSLKRNKELIYEKIRSYGDSYQASLFAEIIEDKEKILDCLMNNGDTKGALALLVDEKNVKYHYRHARQLLISHPTTVIGLWIKLGSKIDFKRVLPLLSQVSDEVALKVVSHAVLEMHNPLDALHNRYILLCARLAACPSAGKQASGAKSDPYTTKLMQYLADQGTDPLNTRYDVQQALRHSTEHRHLQSSVFLLSLLDKHREAVELALERKDLNLAKSTASQFVGEDEIKKQLWLKIARFVISEDMDIEHVCELVKTQTVLKLEDILPYLPDTVKIEHFSDAICDSLDYYNNHIDNLKKDMKLSTEYANRIREEINLLKQQSITVPANSVCAHCLATLTVRPFCLFPCQHFFHIQCLEKVVFPMLSKELSDTLIDVKQKLLDNPDNAELRSAYYTLISDDCCYCGTIAIDNIDVPVIGREEFELEMNQWN